LKNPQNRPVWQQYVDRYRPFIVGYGRKLGLTEDEAEDAAQETLVEFSEAYRAGRYDRDRGRLRSWLFGIAHNCIRNVLRRRQARERVLDSRAEDLLASLAARDDLDAVWEAEWRSAVLQQCLAEARRELQPATVEAFELFSIQGLPAAEVAARLGMTSNAVFGAKHRVLARIRSLLPLMEEVW
jgi:RNA polymerase sigma-70 factor (ECF subfamily)